MAKASECRLHRRCDVLEILFLTPFILKDVTSVKRKKHKENDILSLTTNYINGVIVAHSTNHGFTCCIGIHTRRFLNFMAD